MIEDTMFDYACYAVFLEKEHEKGEAMDDTISRRKGVANEGVHRTRNNH